MGLLIFKVSVILKSDAYHSAQPYDHCLHNFKFILVNKATHSTLWLPTIA